MEQEIRELLCEIDKIEVATLTSKMRAVILSERSEPAVETRFETSQESIDNAVQVFCREMWKRAMDNRSCHSTLAICCAKLSGLLISSQLSSYLLDAFQGEFTTRFEERGSVMKGATRLQLAKGLVPLAYQQLVNLVVFAACLCRHNMIANERIHSLMDSLLSNSDNSCCIEAACLAIRECGFVLDQAGGRAQLNGHLDKLHKLLTDGRCHVRVEEEIRRVLDQGRRGWSKNGLGSSGTHTSQGMRADGGERRPYRLLGHSSSAGREEPQQQRDAELTARSTTSGDRPDARETQRRILTLEQEKEWIRYNPYRMPITKFLTENRPSELSQETVAWICVSAPLRMSSYETTDEDEVESKLDRVDAMVEEWESSEMQAFVRSAPNYQVQDTVFSLARKYRLLTGKWMIFRQTSEVDDTWETIARALVTNRLPACHSAKVSPKEVPLSETRHVICVYTNDFTDRAAVMRCRSQLKQECGITDLLSYKPDVFTSLGIYVNNEWGLRPSIYRSL